MDTSELSRAQLAVFNLLVAGRTNRQIGDELGCSVKTVKAHVTAIFKLTACTNRMQVIVAYLGATAQPPTV